MGAFRSVVAYSLSSSVFEALLGLSGSSVVEQWDFCSAWTVALRQRAMGCR